MKKWSIWFATAAIALAAAFPAYAGWENEDGVDYYRFDSGSRASDQFVQVDGLWYFFDGSGHMLASTWYQKDGSWYYADASGVMQTGWTEVNGEWYYLDASGAMKTGFLDLGGKRYYLDPTTGVMKYNTTFAVDNRTYMAQEDGSLKTNDIITQNGLKLRFNTDGSIDFQNAATAATDESWRPYMAGDQMTDLQTEVEQDNQDRIEELMEELYDEYKEKVVTASSSSRRATKRASWEDKVTRKLSALNASEEQIKEYINDVERGYYGTDDWWDSYYDDDDDDDYDYDDED
ncbi:MAG: hypothetical protein LUE86_09410 [Clostridiales bacterium]|nr:hypothetical protein [Clostridiales bacterium]